MSDQPDLAERSKCHAFCSAMCKRLPREVRDLVYDRMLPPDPVLYGSTIGFNMPILSLIGRRERYWDQEYVGEPMWHEISQAFYRTCELRFEASSHGDLARFFATKDIFDTELLLGDLVTRLHVNTSFSTLTRRSLTWGTDWLDLNPAHDVFDDIKNGILALDRRIQVCISCNPNVGKFAPRPPWESYFDSSSEHTRRQWRMKAWRRAFEILIDPLGGLQDVGHTVLLGTDEKYFCLDTVERSVQAWVGALEKVQSSLHFTYTSSLFA
ncbi:hypothetical protein EJ04DRAFT_580429 [Polyplosphaeria fusca]|uniref:Uncharacterized protein n=1 Tax=Polyplosphaeria fusca TaxID=682080 RepID=A0A9P4UV84_9PLEO|nr:hypothetical protein EJ04DRAFT_580429 [Polyplosphaeria fusca]